MIDVASFFLVWSGLIVFGLWALKAVNKAKAKAYFEGADAERRAVVLHLDHQADLYAKSELESAWHEAYGDASQDIESEAHDRYRDRSLYSQEVDPKDVIEEAEYVDYEVIEVIEDEKGMLVSDG